ncbi:hypothetical protein [Streptomyces sp. P17]|uniref:hypothetical protein n=1 Tax=Streptomyces sp. P17 TaxID=3074716 RepID=UPI0028F408B5|nr:hypothetical protein [Streptomyces sp. P17]MDT9698216.1 hypothetical protein [Streptomyces sp. P17]
MKELPELLGVLALIQGGAGLLNEFTDWDWGLVQRLGLLDGYEIYGGVTLLVLALALFAVARTQQS